MADTTFSKVCAVCRADFGTCRCAVKCSVKLLRDQTTCRKCNKTDEQIAIGDPLYKHRIGFACPKCHIYTCEECLKSNCMYCDSKKSLNLFYTSMVPFDHDASLLSDCAKLIKANMKTFTKYHKALALFNEYVHWVKMRAGKTDISDSPSKKINHMWMRHILDTMSYANFCQKVCGQFVHYDPALDSSKQSSMEIGMMLGARQNVSQLAKKVWGMDYVTQCPTINIFVSFKDKVFTVNTTADTTICMLDKQIKDAIGELVNVLFNGSVASPGRTLEYYGVKDGDTITTEKYVSRNATRDLAMDMLLASLFK